MSSKVKKFLMFPLAALALLGLILSPVYAHAEDGEAPKNIILMIGDGMGASQVTLARLCEGELAMDSFTLGGAMTTHPLLSSGTITDSAAAGTALATGFKTDNGIISQSPEGKNYYTVLENARDDGKSTGLVSTTRITHATPAVFASHILDRDAETEIADQFVEADVDVLLGGGLRHFIPQSQSGSKRQDERDLTKEFQSKGYTYVDNRAGLLGNKDAPKLLGLFTKSHMSYELDRDATKEPSLTEMTEVAINILSKNPEGFFLMVEGGRIDHACHAQDAGSAVADTKAFDDAIAVAFDFAKDDGETLVIVTADHATGGLTIGRGDEQWCEPEVLNDVKASAEEGLAPLLAQDTSAEAIRQVFEEYTGITLEETEIDAIQEGLAAGEGYAITDPIVEVVNIRAHVGWTTHEHDGAAVPVFAYGPGAESFGGFIDNTEVGMTIHQFLGGVPQLQETASATVAVLSDLHIGLGEDVNTWKMFRYNQDILERAIDEINSRGDVDFVLVPGDLTKNSEPYNHQEVKGLLDMLDVPYYVVPGNHDVRKTGMPAENWGIEQFVEAYQGHGYQGENPWYGVDPMPGLHLIGLDSASHPDFADSWGGAISDEQLLWLQEDLAQNGNKVNIVMVHHALIHHEGKDDPLNYCDNAEQIKYVLKESNAKIIAITGHLHVTDIVEEDGLWEIACPATCSYPCAYRVLKLTGDEVFANTIWYPDKETRELALTELVEAGETTDGSVQIGSYSDRWAVLDIKSAVPVG